MSKAETRRAQIVHLRGAVERATVGTRGRHDSWYKGGETLPTRTRAGPMRIRMSCEGDDDDEDNEDEIERGDKK